VAAVFASDTGEAVVQDASIEITVNHPFDMGTKKTILFGKTVVIDLFKSLKMIFTTLIILRFLWLSGAIFRRDVRHDWKEAWIPAGVDFPEEIFPGTRSRSP
jgi:hypothetical protein